MPKISNKGFTLIEIIIATAIVSGVILMINIMGLDIFDFSIFLTDNLLSQQEIQLTLKEMIPEMRSMSQSAVGAYPIEGVFQNQIIFYSDIDGDGLTERIRYYLDGTTFKKGVIKPTGSPLSYPGANEKILEKVRNIYAPAGNIFAYHDENYTGIEAPLSFPINVSSIRLIKITLVSDQSPIDTKARVNFSTSVNLRNL
jgi:prepilin-type N-terminal cleavage/methylation domain-containing protein